MERLTGKNYRSFLESYVSIYDNGNNDTQDLQEQKDIQEFAQMIDELVEEGCDLSEFDYDSLYEYYLEESRGKAALELIKSGIRSALNMPAAAPIRKTLAKGALKGGAETATKVARDVMKVGGDVAGKVYRAARANPIKSIVGGAAAAYDLSKGEKSLIGKGVGLAGQAISAADRAIYGGNKPQTASPSPTPTQPKPKPLRILGGQVVGYGDHFDPFETIKGHLIGEGFAETEKAALAIMANMSEEWKNSIIEQSGTLVTPEQRRADELKYGMKRTTVVAPKSPQTAKPSRKMPL